MNRADKLLFVTNAMRSYYRLQRRNTDLAGHIQAVLCCSRKTAERWVDKVLTREFPDVDYAPYRLRLWLNAQFGEHRDA